MSRKPTPGSPISDLMQRSVVSVSPELSLASFQEFLTVEEFSGAPVVDQNGTLRGIASKTDIVTFLTNDPKIVDEEVLGDVTVGEIMSDDAVTVGVDEPVSEVARKMVDAGVHRVLVLDDGEIRGIVSAFDLLRALY